VIDGIAQTGPKPLHFFCPIVQYTRRGHDQGAAVYGAQRLQGFPQSHIICQHGAQSGLTEKHEPVDTVLLVRTQRRLQIVMQGRLGNTGKIV
jgi:hypothetical protein